MKVRVREGDKEGSKYQLTTVLNHGDPLYLHLSQSKATKYKSEQFFLTLGEKLFIEFEIYLMAVQPRLGLAPYFATTKLDELNKSSPT